MYEALYHKKLHAQHVNYLGYVIDHLMRIIKMFSTA